MAKELGELSTYLSRFVDVFKERPIRIQQSATSESEYRRLSTGLSVTHALAKSGLETGVSWSLAARYLETSTLLANRTDMYRLGVIWGRGAGGWTLVPLRLMIGFGFAAHGFAKLSRGPEHFGVVLAALGVPFPALTSWLTTLLELAGGISIMVGAFVGPVSIPLAAVMLFAMFKVHLQYGFSSVKLLAVTSSGAQFGPTGYEVNLLYIVGLVTIALGGAGSFSVDRFLQRRKKSPVEEKVCKSCA